MSESPVTDRASPPAPPAGGASVRDSLRDAVMTARDVNVYYGDKHAVKNVSLDIGRNQVLAMIGPSGCGKSTGTISTIAGRTLRSCVRASA
jgi:phosphate transport system ATP-binding protein